MTYEQLQEFIGLRWTEWEAMLCHYGAAVEWLSGASPEPTWLLYYMRLHYIEFWIKTRLSESIAQTH